MQIDVTHLLGKRCAHNRFEHVAFQMRILYHSRVILAYEIEKLDAIVSNTYVLMHSTKLDQFWVEQVNFHVTNFVDFMVFRCKKNDGRCLGFCRFCWSSFKPMCDVIAIFYATWWQCHVSMRQVIGLHIFLLFENMFVAYSEIVSRNVNSDEKKIT